MMIGALIGGYKTFSWSALLLCIVTSTLTLCAGYSVGLHRRLIHNSFQCPQWLENGLVYIGVLTSTVGPYSVIEQHDIQDWAQHQPTCHPYFSHSHNPFIDWIWSLHCDIQLDYPPIVRYEPRIAQNRFYHWLEQTRIVQQLPWAIAFYHFGGWSWVFWGIYVRISLCTHLQWLIQYLTHNRGDRPRTTTSNLPGFGLLSFGESWQNNHQAYPESACFSIDPKQYDPGWWLIKGFKWIGLAWNIKRAKVRAPLMTYSQPRPEPGPIEPTPQPVAVAQNRQKVAMK